jgi:hypothetical protein
MEESPPEAPAVHGPLPRLKDFFAGRPSHVLTRFVLLRLLGVVYLSAFLVPLNQAVPLIGHDGLLPADRYLDRVATGLGSRLAGFERLPSLFWVGISDAALRQAALAGVVLSALVKPTADATDDDG